MVFNGSKWILLFVAIALQSLVSVAEAAAPVNALTGQESGVRDVALNTLQMEPGPIRLVGPRSKTTLKFPVSGRQQIRDMTLSLFVTNSISLVERSQIVVSVNGSVIGQVAFKSAAPETRVRMAVPAELVKPGYNTITFAVAQHYSYKCEDPSAPELWSEIDTTRSHLSYKLNAQSIDPVLADLPLLMDKRLGGDYTLTVATTATPDDDLLEGGGLVAQASALSRDYAPVTIRHVTVTPPTRETGRTAAPFPAAAFGDNDAVLMGSRDELAGWLDDTTYQRAAEPLLALFPLGTRKEHFLLVISGADHQQVRRAAATLAAAYATLPPASQANIKEIAAMSVLNHPTLVPGVKQPLSAFGFSTLTRQGMSPSYIPIRFWVPADRFAQPNSELNLHLHMAYGAGLGVQSTLDVYLNNHFEQAIRLSEKLGAVYYDYRLPIPISSLTPGWNELRLQPNLLPEREGGECQPIYDDNLLLTLFDDSYLESDAMGQLAQLPDLRLLARTGYPFAGGRDGRAIRLALTSRDSGNLSAAWSLLAKLAQVTSGAIVDLHAVDAEHAVGNVLLVGQLERVPVKLREASALSRAGWLTLGDERPADFSGSLLGGLFATPALAAGGVMDVSLGDMLKHGILVSQFESPMQAGKSVVMVLADSPAVLADGVRRLTTAPVWGQLALGTAVLRNGNDTLLNYQPADRFLVGDAGTRARISFAFQRSPLMALAVVIGTIVLFSIFTWWMLKRYRHRHHHNHGV